MKRVVVSAPGKVILMGEHAVVYGKPALLASVNSRLTVTISKSPAFQIIAAEGKDYIQHIIETNRLAFRIPSDPLVAIKIESAIPVGYHLGSSAALGAALIGALSFFFRNIWNPSQINQLAYESEKFIHGNASGVDPAAVISGGLIWYRKELDFLRSIWQLPFKPHSRLNRFFLIDTGRPKETTGEMIALVAKNMKRNPEKMQTHFDLNEQQVKRITVALKEGNEEELIDAIRIGERTLEGMGVVSSGVMSLIRNIERVGGAAKILGGGGKSDGAGYVLCYTSKPKQNYLPLVLGQEGIRLEEKL